MIIVAFLLFLRHRGTHSATPEKKVKKSPLFPTGEWTPKKPIENENVKKVIL